MSTTNLFSAFAAPPVPQAQNTTAPAAPKTDELFSAFGSQTATPATAPSPRASAPTAPKTDDLFSAFGQQSTATASAKGPETEQPESSSWLGKSWNFLNEPLLNLHREGATGIEAGAEDFASSLTSPLNVALTLGTMGAGPLLESLGVKLVGEAALPVIKTIGKLAKAGFTSQMVYGLAQEYPQFQVALKNGDTDKALEVGTKLALGGALAFHGAREVAKDVGLVDSKARANSGVDEARGQREATAQSVYQEAREARKSVMDAVSNEVRRGAVQLYAEAGGDTAKLTDWKAKLDAATGVEPKLQRQVSSLLDVAQNLKPAEVEAAGVLRKYYDSLGQQGTDSGLLDGEKLGKYVARSRWTVEPTEADALQAAKEKLGQAQPGRADHLQRRVFESTVDGIAAGYKPESLDAANIAADYGTSMGRELGNKSYVDAALKARAADGRPIAVPANAVRLADDGTRLDTSDYSAVPSPHSQGIEFHPDSLKQAQLILAPERSALADVPGVKQLLKLSTLAKETKLALGGFHWSQIGLRNLMSGTNPFSVENIDLTDPRQAKMVSAGGLQLASPRANSFIEESEAGGGGLLSKVPGVGRFIKTTNDKLFGSNGYIDQSKMKAALSFADRLSKSHPDWDEQTVNRYAGEAANARFGGLNWTAMEKDATYRTLLRTVFLAPDFLLSNLKDGLSALGPAGSINRFDIARIVAFNFAAARVANVLVNGKAHNEVPFGVVSPDGKEVYSIRTMPADVFGGLADPRRFVGNRLSPLANTLQEVVTGRDKVGRTRSTQEQLLDLFGQYTPLPVQNAYQVATGSSSADFRPVDSGLTSLGLSATKNYSPAERKALELASHFSTSGEATPTAQLDKLHETMKLEDSIRSGQVSLDAAQTALQSGQISRQDFANIRKVSKEQEQFPQTARLRSQVRRLPLAAALDVWKLADNDERKDLLLLLHAKAQAWQKNAARTETPRQREDMRMRLAALASDVIAK
jgi:hypothetical protein